jgi:acetoin utilization protein AcuC
MKKALLIHDDQYQNWIFDPTHPTQGRRFKLAAELLIHEASKLNQHELEVKAPKPASLDQLLLVHEPEYLDQVLNHGLSREWAGSRPDLAELAALFAGGTLVGLDALLSKEVDLAIHFAGAKHHAKANTSSGFCIFNDFAIAAKLATSAGHRVAIFDLDAHHGDGTEFLLRAEPVLTYSVHDATIFPGTGFTSEPELFIHNLPLAAGSGDLELAAAVSEFINLAEQFGATMIFIAAGADGHTADPLSTLNYTTAGIAKAVSTIRLRFIELPMLIGGAGGYRPDDITPEVWSSLALAAIEVTKKPARQYFNLANVNFDDDQEIEAAAAAIFAKFIEANGLTKREER